MNDRIVEQKHTNALAIIAFLDEDAGMISNDYLFWFVKLVLFQYGHRGLTIEGLKKSIEEIYLLSYTEEEIIDAIEKYDTKNEIETPFDPEDETYTLSSSAFNEIARMDKTSAIRKYVDDYCDKFGIDWWSDDNDIVFRDSDDLSAPDRNNEIQENSSSLEAIEVRDEKILPSHDDLVNLLSRFIYRKFRESLNQIDGLLSITGHFTLKPEDADVYSVSERRFINGFLDWDNEEKNQMIYDLIGRSFDFYSIQCHEDIRFDFKEYTFILDANILMRFMRINNEFRYESVSQFIKKAKEIGIDLVVSAFTKTEIENSIERQLDAIKETISRFGRVPSLQACEFSASSDFNIDLYKLFHEWYRKQKDIRYPKELLEKFKRRLFRELEEIIKSVSFDEHPSFWSVKDSNYEGVVQSLKDICKSENQAKTDANNVLLTLEYKKTRPNTFMVSSDQILIHWSREIYQAQRSLIEVPSVWLSVLMRYSGRATGEDDYKAYCQFIRLSIDTAPIKNIEERISLSDAVNRTDYSDLVKDRILEEIGNKGKKYLSLERKDAIRMAHDEVLKAERNAGYEEAHKEYKEEKERLINEKEAEIENLRDTLETERKDRMLREEKNKMDSLDSHINDWIKIKVEKRSRVGDFISRNINTIRFALGIVSILFIVLFRVIYKTSFHINDVAGYITLIGGSVCAAGAVFAKMIQERYSENNLRRKYEKKAIKRFSLGSDYFKRNKEE